MEQRCQTSNSYWDNLAPKSTPPNVPEPTLPPNPPQNSSLVLVLQPLPLVHLFVWGYKGSSRMGVDVKEGRLPESGGAPGGSV